MTYAAELKILFPETAGADLPKLGDLVLHTFSGVNCNEQIQPPAHTHLFSTSSKDAEHFTFNDELISRFRRPVQLVYRPPIIVPIRKAGCRTDTWILRPPGYAGRVSSPARTRGTFPRVCGTFKERAGFSTAVRCRNACWGRIHRSVVASGRGGAQTRLAGPPAATLIVAKKLGRRYLGFEVFPRTTTSW